MEKKTLDWSMPSWDDFLSDFKLTDLQGGGDLVLENGDISFARTGDLMLRDEGFSALFRFANSLRYSWPALSQAFSLMNQVDGSFPELNSGRGDFKDLIDTHCAQKISALVCAEGVLMTGSRLLLSLRQVLACDKNTWEEVGPKIKGHSIGRLLEAAANHIRHCEEWRLTQEPNKFQLPSIEVLANLLDKPVESGKKDLGSSKSIEILEAISGLSMVDFVSLLCGFANNLVIASRARKL